MSLEHVGLTKKMIIRRNKLCITLFHPRANFGTQIFHWMSIFWKYSDHLDGILPQNWSSVLLATATFRLWPCHPHHNNSKITMQICKITIEIRIEPNCWWMIFLFRCPKEFVKSRFKFAKSRFKFAKSQFKHWPVNPSQPQRTNLHTQILGSAAWRVATK